MSFPKCRESIQSTPVKPMSLSRHLTMWECEGESERVGRHGIAVWEKLRLDREVPESAKPYCCYLATVIFYTDRTFATEITRCEHYQLGAAPSTHLLRIDGRWWERGDCQIVYRDGAWYARHEARDNTRAAQWANREELG